MRSTQVYWLAWWLVLVIKKNSSNPFSSDFCDIFEKENLGQTMGDVNDQTFDREGPSHSGINQTRNREVSHPYLTSLVRWFNWQKVSHEIKKNLSFRSYLKTASEIVDGVGDDRRHGIPSFSLN